MKTNQISKCKKRNNGNRTNDNEKLETDEKMKKNNKHDYFFRNYNQFTSFE